jgi:hypothetical protein
MFAVEWLRQGVTVEREGFALADLANAVTIARWRAVAVAARHPLEKPNSFRLIDDATGAIVLTVKLYDRMRSDAFGGHAGTRPAVFVVSGLGANAETVGAVHFAACDGRGERAGLTRLGATFQRGLKAGSISRFTEAFFASTLAAQFLRRRIDRLRRLAIERNALVTGKHGPAVERCHLPRPEHAERVLDRPVHCCGDLVGDTQRQWANILSWDRECERPLLPKSVELLAVFLGAAVAFGVMPPFRHPRLLPVSDPCAMLTK